MIKRGVSWRYKIDGAVCCTPGHGHETLAPPGTDVTLNILGKTCKQRLSRVHVVPWTFIISQSRPSIDVCIHPGKGFSTEEASWVHSWDHSKYKRKPHPHNLLLRVAHEGLRTPRHKTRTKGSPDQGTAFQGPRSAFQQQVLHTRAHPWFQAHWHQWHWLLPIDYLGQLRQLWANLPKRR